MPYIDEKGYCRICKRNTPHRFSLKIKCFNCKTESSHEDYLQGIRKIGESQENKKRK
jgi:hypothetical protein